MICILGGTFDPVHFGHLRPALDVQQALGVERVHLLPCRTPPHREPPRLTAAQRLELLRLVVADEPALAIDERELRREGPSYMVDTLQSLRGERGNESLCLALGMDAFAALDSWHRWRDILPLCHLVVMQRPGSDWPTQAPLGRLLRESRVDSVASLHECSAGCILGVPVTQMAVSATRIRELLAQGLSARYLTTDTVLQRIMQEKWYAS